MHWAASQLRLLMLVQQIHQGLWYNSTLLPYFLVIASFPSRNISSCTIWVCSASRTQGCKLNQISLLRYCSVCWTLSSSPVCSFGFNKWPTFRNTEGMFYFPFHFFSFQCHRGSDLQHQEPQTAVLASQRQTSKGECPFYKAQFNLWFLTIRPCVPPVDSALLKNHDRSGPW